MTCGAMRRASTRWERAFSRLPFARATRASARNVATSSGLIASAAVRYSSAFAELFKRSIDDPKSVKNWKRSRRFLLRVFQEAERLFVEAAFSQQHCEFSLRFWS